VDVELRAGTQYTVVDLLDEIKNHMEKILFKLFIYITAFILETINLYRFNVRTISKTLAILKLRLDKVDSPPG
jgi:hypothetical protein